MTKFGPAIRNGWAIMILLLALPRAVHAATITVTSNADSGAGTLRQAIADAGNGDTIDFNFVSGTTITLNTTLTINKNLNILGPGAVNLSLSGNNARRVLHVSGVSNTITGLTVMNGLVTAATGAGVYLNSGRLFLEQCVIRNNSAADNGTASVQGGGIYTQTNTTLVMKHCTVQNNSVPTSPSAYSIAGGGMHCLGIGMIYDSVFNGNQGLYGAAIYTFNNILILENVTVVNNASAYRGAIYAYYGTHSFINCTISGNAATVQNAGGVSVSNAALSLRNTVIAGNTSANSLGNTDIDLTSASLTSSGYNLIGSIGTVSFTPAAGDVTGTEASPAPANLAGLSDYGGYVQVDLPLFTSQAIDPAASNNAPFVDARGFLRVNTADKGAAEYNGTLPAAASATNVGTTGFTAHWDAVPGAEGYALDVAANGSFSSLAAGWGNSLVGNATSWNVTGLSPGTQYYYRIRALAGEHQTYHSNTVSCITLIPTATPTATATATRTATATSSPTATVTPTPTATSTSSATYTPTSSITPTSTVSATHTPSPTQTGTFTITPTVTVTPTVTPTATISATSTVSPTRTATLERGQADLLGKSLVAYPNPGKGKITLLFQPAGSGEAKVRISNLNGESVAVLSAPVSGDRAASVTWDCGAVAPGLYLVRVMQDGREIGKSKVAVLR